uniref:Uncharacterized protein n=1 Tax=Ascaris lumbricoides TaxID=6252 RepID=A0A0M3IR32_ASCLU
MRAKRRQTPNAPNAIDLRKLQERIAELIAENDRLAKNKQQCYDELNDVIIYLKKIIEEQDYEIARLEDIRKQQLFEQEKRITKEREIMALNITTLNNNIEKYRAENLLMSE